MARFRLADNTVVQGNAPVTLDGIQHLRGVLGMTAAERAAARITEVVEQPMPDTRYGFASEDPANPGAWIFTPFAADVLQERLIDYALQRRWERETGGIVVNGVPIATDDRSKLMITGSRIAAQADPEWTTEWAVGDQSFPVNAAMMIAISDAVQAFVNDVFQAAAEIIAAIRAGTITTFDQIDAYEWPANS